MDTNKYYLSDLYKSVKIQIIVFDILSQVFDEKFPKVITQARNFKPYLVKPAELYIEEIKESFIENGFNLETFEDLEIILNHLKVWKHDRYYLERQKFNDDNEEKDYKHVRIKD